MKAARPPKCSAIKQEQKQEPKFGPLLFQCFFPLRPGVLLCLRRKCGFARFRQRYPFPFFCVLHLLGPLGLPYTRRRFHFAARRSGFSLAAGADAKEDATEAVEEGAGSGSACPAGALISPVGAPERAALPALLDGAALLHAASSSAHRAAAARQKENFFIRGASLSDSRLNFCTAVFLPEQKPAAKAEK